jgi:hypothetical protein
MIIYTSGSCPDEEECMDSSKSLEEYREDFPALKRRRNMLWSNGYHFGKLVELPGIVC